MARPKDHAVPLPSSVFSHLGPLPVVIADVVADDGRMGEWDHEQRTLRIEGGNAIATQWQVLGHEMAHAILWDSGSHHSLTTKQLEIVCDAFGTWLAAAVSAGAVTLR